MIRRIIKNCKFNFGGENSTLGTDSPMAIKNIGLNMGQNLIFLYLTVEAIFNVIIWDI
jgi:hypothetical protein